MIRSGTRAAAKSRMIMAALLAGMLLLAAAPPQERDVTTLVEIPDKDLPIGLHGVGC